MGLAQCNPAVYGPGATAANTDARRLLTLLNPAQGPNYSGFYQADDGGVGSYNGMLLSVQKRMSRGFTVLANYTWSHCLSIPVDSVLGTTANYMNPANRNADYGNCVPSDRRQIVESFRSMAQSLEIPTSVCWWPRRGQLAALRRQQARNRAASST